MYSGLFFYINIMLELIIITVFVCGYLAIAFEHPLKINKAASALLTCIICWALYSFSITDKELVSHVLLSNMSEILGILVFLLGAMSIVEAIDSYDGFRIITDRIKTTNKRKLLWTISLITFFLSSVLDNLTTTIVLISLLRKLVDDRRTRLIMAGMIVIAANAGGAWTVIGDLTTTMLWIGKQITAVGIMQRLFLPSMVCLLVPLIILTFTFKGHVKAPALKAAGDTQAATVKERNTIFFLGIGALLFVPVFKTITHLPPFMGILFGLSMMWIYTEFVSHRRSPDDQYRYSMLHAIRRVDMSSVFFFMGILLCITALKEIGTLEKATQWLDHTVENHNIIVMLIGVLSSIVDNVPLVAATQAMYSFPTDHVFWEFIAYCAGTGGSMLIIGSAAGVAAMGLEKIDFIWYLRNMSWLAFLGFFGGALVYLLMEALF
jgi:Na+/H+ antiporter NhaD/arsenite permease-like protein